MKETIAGSGQYFGTQRLLSHIHSQLEFFMVFGIIPCYCLSCQAALWTGAAIWTVSELFLIGQILDFPISSHKNGQLFPCEKKVASLFGVQIHNAIRWIACHRLQFMKHRLHFNNLKPMTPFPYSHAPYLAKLTPPWTLVCGTRVADHVVSSWKGNSSSQESQWSPTCPVV